MSNVLRPAIAAVVLLGLALAVVLPSRYPGIFGSSAPDSAVLGPPSASASREAVESRAASLPQGAARRTDGGYRERRKSQARGQPRVAALRPWGSGVGIVTPFWYPPSEGLVADTRSTESPISPDPAPPEPEPRPPPVTATDLRIEEVGPYSAIVSFATDQEIPGAVGFGWEEPVAFASDEVGREHRIELLGLQPDSEYVVQVVSHTGEDRPETSFETESRPLTPQASTADGRLELDGQPFFPVTAYGACAWTLDNPLAAGVNVFQWEQSCGLDAADDAEAALQDSIDALAERAYWTLPWDDRDLAGDGLIGYTQPDEPDGLGLTPSMLPDIREPGTVTFMTFTQHFSPGTGDLPWQYPGYYEAFVPKADVLGVDFYPLQSLCSPEKLALDHDVQVDLVELGAGRPTLQWIEAAAMKCPHLAAAAITEETIRAEMLLAIAGGANGLGVFPAVLDASAAEWVRSALDAIEQAWPMLMTSRVEVEIGGADASLVRASARVTGGATMIVVANADLARNAIVELRLDGIEGERKFVSVDRSLEATSEDGVLSLELEPLESHILVTEPQTVPPAESESEGEDEEDEPGDEFPGREVRRR